MVCCEAIDQGIIFSYEAKKSSPNLRPLRIGIPYVCVSFLGVGVKLGGGGVWMVWMGSEQP